MHEMNWDFAQFVDEDYQNDVPNHKFDSRSFMIDFSLK